MWNGVSWDLPAGLAWGATPPPPPAAASVPLVPPGRGAAPPGEPACTTLPPLSFTGRVSVASTLSQVDAGVARLRARLRDTGTNALGLDAEWVTRRTAGGGDGWETRPVALLQLAVGGGDAFVELFRLCLTGVPPSLKALLGDGRVRMAGANVTGDATRLLSGYGVQVGCPCELRDAAARLLGGGAREVSLASLVEDLLGCSLPKGAVRLSDWEAARLTDSQVRYAALDAWASLQAYTVLVAMEAAARAPPASSLVLDFSGEW